MMPTTDSPLRYPGGKTQLTDFVENIIMINNIENVTYIEPYAGGFGVGIRLLLNNKVDRVVINDYDKSIYAVWYSILNNTNKLIELIEKTPITIESWREQKEIHEKTKRYRNSIENGFSTLFLNRTNRSGIISAGPIGGYEQKGKYKLDCRFNKQGIIKKIRKIAEKREQIELHQKDAVKFIDTIIEEYNPRSTFCFFDPPYYEQGKNLYTNFYKHKDHTQLAKRITSLDQYYWITTYDYAEQIHEIYNSFENQAYKYELMYSAQRKRKAIEFMFASEKTKLIGKDNVVLSEV